MKNIAFALLVFGIPFLFPLYLVVELRRGVVENSNSGASIQLVDYNDKITAITLTDVVKPIANNRHRKFVN